MNIAGIILFLVIIIGLIGAAVLGWGFYVLVNIGIDRFQGWTRRKQMATPMTTDELLRRRQHIAAQKKAEVMGSDIRITHPYDWSGISKR